MREQTRTEKGRWHGEEGRKRMGDARRLPGTREKFSSRNEGLIAAAISLSRTLRRRPRVHTGEQTQANTGRVLILGPNRHTLETGGTGETFSTTTKGGEGVGEGERGRKNTWIHVHVHARHSETEYSLPIGCVCTCTCTRSVGAGVKHHRQDYSGVSPVSDVLSR